MKAKKLLVLSAASFVLLTGCNGGKSPVAPITDDKNILITSTES